MRRKTTAAGVVLAVVGTILAAVALSDCGDHGGAALDVGSDQPDAHAVRVNKAPS